MPPRVVELFYDRTTSISHSPTPIPVLLHINKQTREFALENYSLVFGTSTRESRIYFDFEVDTLYLGAGNITLSDARRCIKCIHAENNDQLRRVQHFAMDQCLGFQELFKDPTDDLDNEQEEDSEDGSDNDTDIEYNSSVPDLKPLPDDHQLQVFSGLKAITIVETSSTPALKSLDCFWGEVANNKGEFQLWKMFPDGKADRFSIESRREKFYKEKQALDTWYSIERLAAIYIRPSKLSFW